MALVAPEGRGWLVAATGGRWVRLRAGAKAGSGFVGADDVVSVWPPGRAPLVAVVHTACA